MTTHRAKLVSHVGRTWSAGAMATVLVMALLVSAMATGWMAGRAAWAQTTPGAASPGGSSSGGTSPGGTSPTGSSPLGAGHGLWASGPQGVGEAAGGRVVEPPLTGKLREIRSDHYIVRTDLEPELAKDMVERLDRMFDEYSRRMQEFLPAEPLPPFKVYLFEKKIDYMKLTGNRVINSGGVFMGGPNILASYLEDQGREQMGKTIQHEGFHQFAYVTVGKVMPIWLNEGMAELFGEGIWTGGGFWVNQVPPIRLRELKADIDRKKLLEFEKFFAMSHQDWVDTLRQNPEQSGTYYNQAWAVVYWLVHGDKGHRQKLVSYLKLLNSGTAHEAAWAQAFDRTPAQLQDEWVAWLRRWTPTPEAVVLERQKVLGDMLIALEARGMRPRDATQFRSMVTENRLQLTYDHGRFGWKTDDDPTIYFRKIDGELYKPAEMALVPRGDDPLPAIVTKIGRRTTLLTRFYELDGRLRSETRIEVKGG